VSAQVSLSLPFDKLRATELERRVTTVVSPSNHVMVNLSNHASGTFLSSLQKRLF
jgi:hypothetical protein